MSIIADTPYAKSIAGLSMPSSIAALPITPTGFPVPWFADVRDGVADLRVIRPRGIEIALREARCWICGRSLGTNLSFVVGPMCVVSRISSEPPSHHACAEFAAKACPFLANPKTRRNDNDLPLDTVPAAGIMLLHNPGVTAIYTTRSFKALRPGTKHGSSDGILLTMGGLVMIEWFAEGRKATRAEVEAAVERGLPALRDLAQRQGMRAVMELNMNLDRVKKLYPKL